jgi:hypothetical protein
MRRTPLLFSTAVVLLASGAVRALPSEVPRRHPEGRWTRQGYRAPRHQNLADMTLYGDALGLGGGSDKCRGGVARTIFPSTLSSCSQNRPPYCAFSGLGDCPNNIILSFPSPEKTSTLIYEGIPQVGLLLIHCAECEHQSNLVLSIPFGPHSSYRVGRRARDSPGRLDILGNA